MSSGTASTAERQCTTAQVPILGTDRQAPGPIKESHQPHPSASLVALQDSGSNRQGNCREAASKSIRTSRCRYGQSLASVINDVVSSPEVAPSGCGTSSTEAHTCSRALQWLCALSLMFNSRLESKRKLIQWYYCCDYFRYAAVRLRCRVNSQPSCSGASVRV